MNPPSITEGTETEEQAEARIQATRLRNALDRAPALLAYIRELITETDGRTERGDMLREESTPLITQYVDDSDHVYAQLIMWVRHWSATLHLAPPAVSVAELAWGNGWNPQGFRAEVTSAGAETLTRMLTSWLKTRGPAIETADPTGSYARDVLALIWSLSARYPMSPSKERPARGRDCFSCGETNSVEVWWRSAELLDVTIQCVVCGLEDEPVDLKHLLKWLPEKVHDSDTLATDAARAAGENTYDVWSGVKQ